MSVPRAQSCASNRKICSAISCNARDHSSTFSTRFSLLTFLGSVFSAHFSPLTFLRALFSAHFSPHSANQFTFIGSLLSALSSRPLFPHSHFSSLTFLRSLLSARLCPLNCSNLLEIRRRSCHLILKHNCFPANSNMHYQFV